MSQTNSPIQERRVTSPMKKRPVDPSHPRCAKSCRDEEEEEEEDRKRCSTRTAAEQRRAELKREQCIAELQKLQSEFDRQVGRCKNN